MMVMVMMVMGYNSGVVGESKESVENRFLKSLVGLSNEFLNVFTSFGEMVGSVLGLNLESKKSDVGNYFKKVQETVQGIKDGLNKIVGEMKKEKNPNAEATATSVKTLVESTLDKIIDGAKEASEAIGDASDPIGNVSDQNAGAVGIEVDKLVKGLKSIVDIVLKEGKNDAGDDKKASDGSTSRTGGNAGDGEAGKLFASANAGTAENAKKSAADAAKVVGTVTGADILQSMIEDNGEAVKLASSNAAVAAVNANKKDGVIAGGIALRAMAKDGKFAGPSDAASVDAKRTVKGAAVSAVIKTLDTLTVAIRKTVDLGLKNVKEAMKINANATSVLPDKDVSDAKNQ
ncbi:variable large family protein [Borrelia crocidurae]|nr:variable large family protein [Borrelia crocidurae]